MKEKVGSIELARIVSILVVAVAIFGIGLLLMSNEASATPDGIATVELTTDNFMIDIVNIGDELTLQYDDSLTPSATGVTADLTDYGGTAIEALYDDGTNGDPFGGDNIWTVVWTVTDPAPAGIDLPAPVTITITATDGLPPDDIQTPTIMKVAAQMPVDTIAPSITLAGSLTVSTNNVGPAFNAAITDGVTYSAGNVAVADGDIWIVDLTALTGTLALPPATEDFVIAGTLDNPAQTFTETVTDNAGNQAFGSTAPFDVDNEPPSILAMGSLTVSTNNVGPAGNAAITDGVTYSAGTVVNPDGDIWTVDLTALTGNAALPPATEDFVIAGSLDNPAQTFTETVTDDAGNPDSGNTAPFDVDNEPPLILAQGTLTVSTNNVGPAGNAAITDGVTYSAGTVTNPDGDTWTVDLTALTGTGALPPAIEDFVIAGALDNPAQTFTETVTDDAGNIDSGSTAGFDVDNEPPSILTQGTLTVTTNNVGPAGNAAITDGVTYSAGAVTIPDGDFWIVDLNALTGFPALPPATEVFVIPGSLDNPAQTFTETVTDDAGNTNSGNTAPFDVDNEAPSITAAGSLIVSTNNVGPAGNAAITDGVTYSTGTVAVADSDTWLVDLSALTGTGALPPATEDFVIAGTLDTPNQTFTETVTDDAGNTDSGNTAPFNVDNEAPSIMTQGSLTVSTNNVGPAGNAARHCCGSRW
jgi:hypothetical protein